MTNDEKRFWRAYKYYTCSFKFSWTGLILGTAHGLAVVGVILWATVLWT